MPNRGELHREKRRRFVTAAITRVLVCVLAALSGGSQLVAATTRARSPVDQDYIAALAAANRFLQAWQNQDHESAIILLSDKLKQHTSEQALETFFTPADRSAQAYEISSGRKLAAGRYLFTVKLFNSTTGTVRHRPSHLVVTRTGRNDWAIDKLP